MFNYQLKLGKNVSSFYWANVLALACGNAVVLPVKQQKQPQFTNAQSLSNDSELCYFDWKYLNSDYSETTIQIKLIK